MKNGENHIDELFEAARSKPTEIGLEDVSKMVAGFPLTPAPFDWSSIINLNSIIMTSVSAFIIAGSFMLYTGSAQNPASNPEEQAQEPVAQIIGSSDTTSEAESPAQESQQALESSPIHENPTPPAEQLEASLSTIAEVAPETPETPEPTVQAEVTVDHHSETTTMIVISDEQSTASIHESRTDHWRSDLRDPDELEDPQPLQPRTNHFDSYEDGRMEFNVSDFTGVSVSGSYEVHVKQNSSFKVYAEGKEESLEKMEIEVKNGKLEIKTKKKKNGKNCNSYSNCERVKVVVEMPWFDDMSVAGSGELIISNFTGLDNVEFSVAGSGSIDAAGDLEMSGNADISIAGSGEMNIDGSAESADISIAGSGDFNGLDLRVKDAELSIAGSGEIGIHAEENLEINIAGSGEVEYVGNPNIKKSVMGSGDIRSH